MNRKSIKIYTEKQFTRLNEEIEDFLKDKKNGIVHIFTKHTTCAIKIIENELLLLADINNFLDELIPPSNNYMHDKIEIREVPANERINAHSHLKQFVLPTSETIPVENGKMLLGKWQSVFLVELDPARDREVIISFIPN
jgi:secondary thiamine-phosphate synthase enzyme